MSTTVDSVTVERLHPSGAYLIQAYVTEGYDDEPHGLAWWTSPVAFYGYDSREEAVDAFLEGLANEGLATHDDGETVVEVMA